MEEKGEIKEIFCSTNRELHVVLSKLSTKCLVRFKTISKGWKQLIGERSLRNDQLKTLEPLAGFFYRSRNQLPHKDRITFIPIASPEVEIDYLDFLPERVVNLNSNFGRLCCQTSITASVPGIYIINPVIKEWTKINCPIHSAESSITLAFDPLKNPTTVCTTFNLVIVTKEGNSVERGGYFSFQVYSSDTKKWKRSIEMCLCNHSFKARGSICIEGICYWLTDNNSILMFDPENEKSYVIMGPPLPATEMQDRPEICIGETEGKVHYVLINKYGVQLWKLNDHVSSKWDLTYTSTLEVLDREIRRNTRQSEFNIAKKLKMDCNTRNRWWIEALSFKDNILLMRVREDVCIHNFETKKMSYVGSLDDIGQTGDWWDATVSPYNMSLVPPC